MLEPVNFAVSCKLRIEDRNILYMQPTVEHFFPFLKSQNDLLVSLKKESIGLMLTQIAQHGASQGVHFAAVSFLMSEVRQLIELLPAAERDGHRWLRMYCHFCVHARPLDGDIVVYQILDEIADASEAAMIGGESLNNLVYKVIPGALSPLKLRGELKAIFAKFGLNCTCLDDEVIWPLFVQELARNIAFKRLAIPPEIVVEEIQAMGGLVPLTPSCSAPTKEEVPHPLTRRAKTYFRRMATIVGFPGGVPVSLQLAPRWYLLECAMQDVPQEGRLALEQALLHSFPNELVWVLGIPSGQAFAPFSPTGELPGACIGTPPSLQGWP